MDLSSANQNVQDLIEVAQLNQAETTQFLGSVSKELSSINVSLDCLTLA